jgi:trk system potassium uptake protein TrkA
VYIVVVGAGKVGFHLTRSLMAEGEEVLVIEKDPVKAERIITELGGTAINGDGAEVATLEEAGVGRADVVAAVTGHDEDNLIVAQVAKQRFNVPRTVARINNPRNEFIFNQLGIDATVSATQVILSIIQQEIPRHPFIHLLTLAGGSIEFIELEVSSASPIVGRPASEIELPEETAVPFLIRSGQPIVVEAGTTFEPGDRIIAVTTGAHESDLRARMLGQNTA